MYLIRLINASYAPTWSQGRNARAEVSPLLLIRVFLEKASFIHIPLEKCGEEKTEEPVIFLIANDSYLENTAREHHTLDSLGH